MSQEKKINRFTSWLPGIAMIILAMTANGCFNEDSNIEKPEVFIPQNKMTEIIYDLSVADGLLNNPRIRSDFRDKDSVQNYMDVIEHYGYTKEIFDENLNYYFVKTPKTLSSIYEKVLSEISMKEAELMKKQEPEPQEKKNLWPLKSTYNLPDYGVTDRLEFSVPLEGPGVYTLKFQLNLFDDDQSIDPRTVLMFWKADTTENGVTQMWDTIHLKKTGKYETLEISKELTDSTFTELKGFLLDNAPQQGRWEKHLHITGISLTRSDPEKEPDKDK